MSSLNHSTHASEGSIWEHSIPRMGSCLVLCCIYMADCQKTAASQRKFTLERRGDIRKQSQEECL
jgi:hypothetical protein